MFTVNEGVDILIFVCFGLEDFFYVIRDGVVGGGDCFEVFEGWGERVLVFGFFLVLSYILL